MTRLPTNLNLYLSNKSCSITFNSTQNRELLLRLASLRVDCLAYLNEGCEAEINKKVAITLSFFSLIFFDFRFLLQ